MGRKTRQPADGVGPSALDVQAEPFLRRHEVFRDPVQRDIPVTALERCLIDTPAFQRLRGLKQLGATHLVYPGAVHTRFDHSLGVLAVAEKLVRIMNENFDRASAAHRVGGSGFLRRISRYEHLLIRLTALLHDVAQMPFGHTFSREGGLGAEEWDDSESVDVWLGDSSETSVAGPLKRFLELASAPDSFVETLLEDLERYLAPAADPMKLPAPFVSDVVSNTLSADLLDYLERDAYFCGLRGASADRVLQYLCVMNLRRLDSSATLHPAFQPANTQDARGRVVLALYRYQTDHSGVGEDYFEVRKLGLLAEAVDLLRGRLALAEKVYFHRTKAAASAMLISAATTAGLTTSDFRYLDDEELLALLAGDRGKDDRSKVQMAVNGTDGRAPSLVRTKEGAGSRSRTLIGAYRARSLYMLVYERRRQGDETLDGFQESNEFKSLVENTRDPEWRHDIEELLERNVTGLEPGGVAVYCPDNEMNRKEFRVLVHQAPNALVEPLGTLVENDPDRAGEMTAIRQGHKRLWALRVFVDRRLELPQQALADLSAVCVQVFKAPNARRDFSGGRPLVQLIQERLVRDLSREYGVTIPSATASEAMIASLRLVDAGQYRGAEEEMERVMKSYLEQQVHAASKRIDHSEGDHP